MIYLDGKLILVTGGTGFIGSAIVSRLLTEEHPERVLVFSRDVSRQRLLAQQCGFDERLHFKMGDVQDADALAEAVEGIQLVIHAAACKDVPACERSPREAININIIGSLNVLQACLHGFVSVCLAISTDKACYPTGVMGMTKALMERLFIQYSWGSMRTLCVRSGNVIGSQGSVLPLWRRQIETGGPITLTDVRMTRYFIPVEKLVDLIFQALSVGRSGEIFVPKMRRVSLLRLAEVMVEGTGVQIEEVGIRPGERLDEELISQEELGRTSDRGTCYAITPRGMPCEGIQGVERSLISKSEIAAMFTTVTGDES